MSSQMDMPTPSQAMILLALRDDLPLVRWTVSTWRACWVRGWIRVAVPIGTQPTADSLWWWHLAIDYGPSIRAAGIEALARFEASTGGEVT